MSQYKNIKFQETDNDLYQKIKKTRILSQRQLEFVAYLSRLEPYTGVPQIDWTQDISTM